MYLFRRLRIKIFLYLIPFVIFVGFFLIRENQSLMRYASEMEQLPFLRKSSPHMAKPIEPPPGRNEFVAMSNEDKNDDPEYDGQKVNELVEAEESEEEDEEEDEEPKNVDPLSDFVDKQVVPPPNDKPEIDRTSAGEWGKAVIIDKDKLGPEERKLYDKGWKNNGFNEYVSLMISLHRSLPDPRDKECTTIKYPDELPDASVIMTFHNEAWTVLLRSVHSIIDRSPPSLLKEIILVDDFSNMDHLKEPLKEYMDRLDIVKIVRTKEREGLIRARLLGYEEATGAVLIFLDSHIECAEGWIQPLLYEIALNKTTSVTPVIDVINDENFAFQFQPAKFTNVGGFDWSLTFTWHGIPEAEQRRRNYKHYLPVRSPTMAGGLFAIGREFFTEIGTYDEGMDIWGAENLELSFRIWMCGGSLLSAPCSHVGHIFRKRSPYTWGKNNKPVLLNNNLRMAEVWLDEFKDYYYQLVGYNKTGYGDISARKALRERLQCKDFNWFITHIYPEIFVPGEAKCSGQIKSKIVDKCIEGPFSYGDVNGQELTVYRCASSQQKQLWYYTKDKEIKHRYACFDYNESMGKLSVVSCHSLKGNQEWEYREDNTIHHPSTNKCITLSENAEKLSMESCLGIDRQIWYWDRHPPKGPARRW